MPRLIILDRDGVINQDSDNFIKSVAEFVPIPGSIEAISQLCQAGYTVVVATNQSGIARNLLTLETLEAMHEKLQDLLAPLGGRIERFYYCPHGPESLCDCRKPKPGMILQIARDFFLVNDSLKVEDSSNVEDSSDKQQTLSDVYVVGDSLRDLQAGRAAGTQVALVKTGKGMRTLKKIIQENLPEYEKLPVYTDLADFTQQFLPAQTEIAQEK